MLIELLIPANRFCIVLNKKYRNLRALSSAGSERTPHTRKVTGSIPVAPTENPGTPSGLIVFYFPNEFGILYACNVSQYETISKLSYSSYNLRCILDNVSA